MWTSGRTACSNGTYGHSLRTWCLTMRTFARLPPRPCEALELNQRRSTYWIPRAKVGIGFDYADKLDHRGGSTAPVTSYAFRLLYHKGEDDLHRKVVSTLSKTKESEGTRIVPFCRGDGDAVFHLGRKRTIWDDGRRPDGHCIRHLVPTVNWGTGEKATIGVLRDDIAGCLDRAHNASEKLVSVLTHGGSSEMNTQETLLGGRKIQ